MNSSSESTEGKNTHSNMLFAHQRLIHSILGRGKVTDIILWRNPKVSGAILAGVTLIWFLFEIVEYNFITLICHISITAMLSLFIWCQFFDCPDPTTILEVLLDESWSDQLASKFHVGFNKILSKSLDVACGRDPALFFLIMFSLYTLSVIGSYFSFPNLVFLGYLLLQMLPFLYDLHEEDADKLAGKLVRKLKKMYQEFESIILSKFQRGLGKEKNRI